MKYPLFYRVLISFITLIVAIFILIYWGSISNVNNHYTQFFKENLEKHTNAFQNQIDPLILSNDSNQLTKVVKELSEATALRITIIAAKGRVLAESDQDPATMESHFERPELIQARTNNVGMQIRYSATLKEDMIYSCRLCYSGTNYYIRVSENLRNMDLLIDTLRQAILKILLIAVFLAIIGSFILARRITKPIQELMLTAQEVTGGNLSARVDYRKQDEMGELAKQFNLMIRRCSNLVDQLSNQKDALNLIISNLQEGLLVADRDGKIILVNQSFSNLTSIPIKVNEFYWNSIHQTELMTFIEALYREKTNMQREIVIADKNLMCVGVIDLDIDQIVITLYDISEIVAVAKMKREFAANVSHELRTPLTSIKGFAETALETVCPENRNYIEIIDRNADRLIKIVEDLLQISKLENNDLTLELEKIEPLKLINVVTEGLANQFKKKQLDLNINKSYDLPVMIGDYHKLQQVFINLIDNALKYTEKGSINIDFKVEVNRLVFIINDTGLGMQAKDLSHIFERFYVVDKSRSRQLGGTGLGLSIVKHIVQLHNGQIEVDSTLGKGTTFRVSLPLV